MMALASAFAAWSLPRLQWLPALCCAAVALWLARLPAREDLASEADQAASPSSSGNSGSV